MSAFFSKIGELASLHSQVPELVPSPVGPVPTHVSITSAAIQAVRSVLAASAVKTLAKASFSEQALVAEMLYR